MRSYALRPSPPATLNEVLLHEVRKLRPHWLPDFKPEGFTSEDREDETSPNDPAPAARRAKNLRELFRRIHASAKQDAAQGAPLPADRGPLAALCLSGGGIRSATFNLGILQCLAQHHLLGKFDYLSSVSGGGYIAGWLRTWMRRSGTAAVLEELRSPDPQQRNPLAPEPEPIERLREYSNYLTPRLGLFSGDTWSAAAIIVRNLILNWLVIVPLLASVIALPLLFLLFVKSEGIGELWFYVLLIGALAIELFASVSVYRHRRFTKKSKTPQQFFLLTCVFPIYLASAALSWAAVELRLLWLRDGDPAPAQIPLVVFAAVWCVIVPVIGWLIAEVRTLRSAAPDPRAWRRGSLRELIALVVSGAIAAALLVGMVIGWLAPLHDRPVLFVILAMPLLLALYFLSRTLFIAFADVDAGHRYATLADEADREWWARLSGWILFIAVGWVGVTTVCFLGGYVLEWSENRDLAALFKGIVTALGGASGLLAALIAGGAKRPGAGEPEGGITGIRKLALAVAAPLFAISTIVGIGWLTIWLGELVTRSPGAFDVMVHEGDNVHDVELETALTFIAVPPALCLLSLFAGLFVNVNRFSLHGLYRNRLVRAYLGASNPERKPDPFTGFALEDNLPLHDLWHEDAQRPLPIINVTLNLVRGAEKLAWQQRKAESFSMTPFYCGNFHEGYRRSDEYGGPDGISVGTAVTISGAAANPSMGYVSSPVLGFLLTMFNMRLGAWLGNTNGYGDRTCTRPGPKQAVWPFLAEMFGLTTNTGKYVSLSDGGHFDNLGLYEAVLRRNHYILASDAGQDDKFAFEDLGNAIRKIRIDLGIPIVFKRAIRILPRSEKQAGMHCAVADICYGRVDGEDALDGKLVYIKPTLRVAAPVPYDVYSYAESSQTFPHEPTSDQWFTESQFESYRALGFHLLEQVSCGRDFESLTDFMQQVEKNIEGEPAARRVRRFQRGSRGSAAGHPGR